MIVTFRSAPQPAEKKILRVTPSPQNIVTFRLSPRPHEKKFLVSSPSQPKYSHLRESAEGDLMGGVTAHATALLLPHTALLLPCYCRATALYLLEFW